MKKVTLIVLALLAFSWHSNAQSIIIGTGTSTTTSTGSDPIDGYFNAFRYQVVYTAAELSASLTPYDEITALGWSIAGDYAGGNLLGYTIKMGHTSATNSASHDASSTIVVKNAFDYNPTVTAAGVFDMIAFDTNFVWNGVDNILVEVCSDGQNPFSGPYGQVRTTTTTNGSRRYRVDSATACGVSTNTSNADKPNIQFNYIDGTPPACIPVSGLSIDSFNASTVTVSWTANNGETAWEVAVQPDGTGEPVGSGTATSSNPYVQLGLSGSTAYEVYVRANCAGDGFSDWVGPVDFTTPPSAPPACVSTYTPSPDASCGNYDTTLSWDAAATADGYFVTVGTSTGANDILDNFDAGSSTSVSVSSQTAGTTYYYTISPYNVAGTNTTCPEQTYSTVATGCLCASVPTSNDGSGISNVRLDTTDFPTGDVTYFDHSGTPIDLAQGITANCEITFETGFTYGVNIWIDFNDDNVLDGSELVFTGESTNANPVVFQADFPVPGAAALGTHKMRIVTDDDPADATDPCNSTTFGVTLDFDVNITAVSCVPAVIASAEAVEDCIAGTYVVEIEVTDTGTATFIVGDAPNPIVVGTNTFGPYALGVTSPDFNVIDVTDSSCNFNIGTFINETCPPPAPVGVTCTSGSSTIVFTEEFEDLSTWTGDIDVAGDGDWETNDNGGGSGGTGPDSEHSGPADSYMAYEASSDETTIASAVSPAINLTNAVDGAELAFYMHAFGADIGTLNVGVGTSPTGPFTTEFTWSGEWQTAASDPWVAVGVDISAYMGSVIYIEFSYGGAGTGFEGDLAIDAMTVEACGNFCIDPSALAVSNITNSGADIAWTPGGAETDWEVAVQAAGTGEPAGAGTPTTSNPYSATGLTGETDYEVYVRADCGGTFSLWVGPVNFTTACDPVIPNYTANMSVNVPDACWDEAGSGEVIDGPGGLGASDWTTGSYGVGPSNKINLWQNVDREWLLSPTFDLSGGTYQLEVNVAVTNYNNGAEDDTMGADDEVQLLVSTDGGATWSNLTTWNAANEPDFTGTEYIEDLSAYTGTAQFAIWASDGAIDNTEDYDFHVGKFVVRTPPTCGDVSAITIDSFDSTSAQISWTDAEGETNWEIAVQPAGTGVPGTANDTGTDTTSNPYSATGLSDSTAYEVYVRADCSGDGSNLGSWIGPVNFSTLPQGPSGVTCSSGSPTYIFTEEFAVQGDWTGNINGGDGTWEIPGGATSTGTGPDSEFSGATNSYMNYEASSNATTTASAVSPAIDLSSAVDGAELSFYMHAYGEAMGTLNVGVGTSPAGPFTTEFTWTGQLQTSDTDAWVPVGVDLSAYLGSTIYIEFSHTGTGTDFTGDMSIDYMRVQACGAFCIDPTDIVVSNVNGSEADIAWTANGTETAWEVAVQPVGTGIPAGPGTATATNPYTQTGLTALTAYEVYVRADCGSSTFSGWAGPVNFSTTAACPDVSGITVDSFTDTTAEISWTAGGGVNELGFEIAVQPAGTGVPAGAGAAATNPYSATGLTAETAYEVYVRSNCDVDGFSNWVGPVNFTTACAAIVPDYAADMSLNVPDSCWEEAGSGEVVDGPGGLGASDWRQNRAYAYGPSNAINLWQSVDREWLISPTFDLSGGAYELVVNVAVTDYAFSGTTTTSDTMGSDDEVQLLMSTDGGTTWTNLTTWNVGNQPSASGTEYIEDLSAFTGNAQFAIWASDGTVDDTEDYDFHIGRFEVRTPLACPDVNTITASSLTATSASIGWTNGGSETAWEVAVQLAGTGVPTSGTPTATNPYSATGLTAETTYEVYVRADCGGIYGAWAGPYNFTTPCEVYTPDYTEDFATFLDSCWDEANGGDLTAGPASFGTGGFGAEEFAHASSSGLGAVNINLFLGGPDIDWLLSPSFDLSADGYELLVDVAMTDYNATSQTDGFSPTDEVRLVYSNDGTNWTTLVLWNDANVPSATGQTETVDLTGITGANVQFAIYVSEGTDNGRDIDFHIDNFVVRTPPTCPDVSNIIVSNITTSSAQIDWTNGGSETAWEVAVQPQGTGTPDVADGSGADTAVNPYNASGLNGSTAYEVYVRAECVAGTDFGAWIGPVNFTTDCDTFSTFPYSEGFESGVPPLCWTSFRGTNGEGTGFDWTTSTTANSGSTSAFVRYEAVTTSAEDWLVTPAFDMSGLTNPQISFYARQGYGSEYGTTYTIRVSTTDTDHASFTTVQTYTESDFSATTFEQFSVDLSAYNSDTTVYIAFVMENNDGDNWYIDDVLVSDDIPGTYTYTDGVWSPSVPGNPLDDIIIASGDLVIDSDFTCNTMIVNPGASVTVNSGSTLTATNGTTLESTSTSYSSFILNGAVSGPLSYGRHVNINGSGTTGSNDLVSAPLTGQPFNAFAAANPNLFSNTAGDLFLFGPYDKTIPGFVTYSDTETTPLAAGVGYRAATDDNGTLTFTGTAENGVITNDIINFSPNGSSPEWNLVGNPYPSYMLVWEFLLHDVGGVANLNLFDPPTAAIYGYDGSALNGWTIYNLATTTPSTVMAPGQGFFVSADAANVAAYDLEFTPAMRATGNGDDFIVGRNAGLTYLILNVSASNKSYNTDFYFNTNASQGFDLGYDAAVWGDDAPEFAVYSHLVQDNNGTPMALQALNGSDLTDVVVPLGVNANQGEQITFSIADSTLPESVNVYLEDNVANTVTLLNGSDYVITPSTDLSGTGRFYLRYTEDALSTIENSIDKLEIFALNSTDELVVSGQLLGNSTLELFDIQGRKVLSTMLDETLLQNRINVANLNAGVYIVTVQSDNKEKTKKVIIE